MDEDSLRLTALAQHGLVTRRQILDHGGSDTLLRRRLASGQWVRSRRGVVVVGASAATWKQEVMAACLAGGDGVVASERTASRIWGLVARSGRIQLLSADSRQVRLRGVDVRRTTILPAMDRTTVDSIPVTSIARTLADVAPGQDLAVVGQWIDDAMRRLGLDLRELRSCVARLQGPGRADPKELRHALALRDEGYDPGDSHLESRTLLVLAAAGLPTPVQQYRVDRGDGETAFIDLAYPNAWLAIELDGFAPHGGRTAFDRDRIRGNALTLLGWRVLHFTSTTTDDQMVRAVTEGLRLGRPVRAGAGQ